MSTPSRDMNNRSRASSTESRKKWARSQSPTAIEKRRQQNRTAQRNYRRKLKEQSGAGSSGHGSEAEECKDHRVYSSDQSFRPTTRSRTPNMASSSRTEPLGPNLADNMAIGTSTPWIAFDHTIPDVTQAYDRSLSGQPLSYPFCEDCNRNSMGGPCAFHLDEIDRQILSSSIPANPRLSPSYPGSHTRSRYPTSPALSPVNPGGSSLSPGVYLPQASQGMLHPDYSQELLPASTPISPQGTTYPVQQQYAGYGTGGRGNTQVSPSDYAAYPYSASEGYSTSSRGSYNQRQRGTRR